MAQPFSLRYPLIDGHGNFGSTDDGAAAMRYTEARLSKMGDAVLSDIDKGTVDFIDNYDGSEIEPTVLPAVLPNLLANGTSGIAVGMATNIPPHNLGELTDAIKLYCANENVSIEEIKEVLKGPDFPTGAEVIGIDGIDEYFRTGHGSVTIRAKTEIEDKPNGKAHIVVRELPYMVGKKDLMDRITDLVKDKKIEGISDLQDYSSLDEGMKIVIETKKDIIPEVLLNQLYKQTQLQTTFGVNMLALINGEPKILNIIDSIKIYVDHQIDVLTRKLKFELDKDLAREHILEGLHIATKDIDKVIALIRKSRDNDEAIATLMASLKLDDAQAKAITEMKLRSLSGMEREKIEAELATLRTRIVEIRDILSSRQKQIDLIVKQLEELNAKLGDERKTIIRSDISSDIDNEDLIPKQDILITMSSRGYLKRLPVDTYKAQKRGGVGVIGLQTHEDDDVEKIITANTHMDLLIFTDFGKVYRIRGHHIPMGSRTSKGIPAINIIPIEKSERILTILPVETYEGNDLFFCTVQGIIKKTNLIEFDRINKSGKIAITLKEGDKLFSVISITSTTDDNEEIYIGANNGNMVRFSEDQVRAMGRTAAGVHGIDFDSAKDKVVGLSTSSMGNKILSVGAKGVGKLSDVNDYRMTKRNAKGVRTLKVNDKTGQLVFVSAVQGNEDALMITTTGKVIRFSLNSLNTIGRSTSGVRLMRVESGEKIQSITMFKSGELGDSTEEHQIEAVDVE
jgi:DNA gyrase subunit A